MTQLLPHPLQAQARIDTPLGPLTAAATARGLAGLWFDGQKHHPGLLNLPHDPAHPWLAQVGREVRAYFSGATTTFLVPLDMHGTPFQQAVWCALRAIPAGATRSYGELAIAIGLPAAVRAAAAAVGRNPVSIVVPCHRVIGHDGSLTGYAGGLPRKQALLDAERARAGLPLAA